MKRRRRRVTVTTPWGTYQGFIVKVAHDLHLGGKCEKVYAIETSDGRRYAKASWIGGRR